MQNVQNIAEIEQKVINLVELYRTKVGKESDIARKAKLEKEYWEEENEKIAKKYFEDGGTGGFGIASPDMPEEWVRTLRVNDHLLGHFYSDIAGNDADKNVLSEFLADYYDSTVFTAEEEGFLRSHFKEMVNYIIQTPCDDLECVNKHDGKDWQLIPNEVLHLIRNRVDIPVGSTIYNPFTGFAQIPLFYPGCTFYCEDSYASYNKRWNAYSEKRQKETNENLGKYDVNLTTAWMKIVLYANSINSRVVNDGLAPCKYDHVVSFIPDIPNAIPEQASESEKEKNYDPEIVNKILTSYENIPDGGVFVVILQKKHLWASNSHYSLRSLWEKLIKDNSLKEVVQLPSINNLNGGYCLVIAEKGKTDGTTTMIDARFAIRKSNQEDENEIFDLNSFKEMLVNNGRECATGLRKMIPVPTEKLNVEILIPQIYVIEKPLDMEAPIPLSMFGTLATTRIRSLKINLPEDTPWVELNDLSLLFKGELDVASLKKAGCPNNPVFVEGSKDYAFNESGHFIDSYGCQLNSKKGFRVYKYRCCAYLDGSKDAVLFGSTQSGMGTAIVRCGGKPIAIGAGITVFVPKDGVDALHIAALLRLPVVQRQIQAYTEFDLDANLNDILVPTDKRIINDELSRMKREESVIKELGDKVQAMKTEYINEVRMRKHDMGQKVFDLINTEDLMRFYVENRETESDVWVQIKEQLDHFRGTIHKLSKMLDHLSQEEQFGTPELLDLNDYLANLQHSNNVSGFTLSYQLDRESVLDVQLSRIKDKDIKDWGSVKAIPTIYMAKNDLERVVSNILTNAQNHGFKDTNRKDYEVNIRLVFNAEKGMYQIDFRNNGTPLPEGLNKMRYGIKGEKAGKNAGTGLGGSVVKSIVEHYKGDYDVFMDGDWTVIRIYLPIAI